MGYPRQEPSENDYALAERRWKSIVRMKADGKTNSEICRNTGFKAKAIDRVLATHGPGSDVAPPTPQTPPPGVTPGPAAGLPAPGPVPARIPMPPAPPAPPASSPMAAPSAPPTGAPNSPVDGVPAFYRNADPAGGYSPTQGYDPANGPTPVYPTTSPQTYVAFGGGAPSGQAMESPLAGAYEIPDLYNMLYAIMLENGLKPTFAVGIVRQFRHYKPNDYPALANILRIGGVVPQARDSIVNAWRLENEHDSVGDAPRGPAGPNTEQDRLARMEKELGLASHESGSPSSPLDMLEKKERELRIEAIQLELSERRKRMGLPAQGTGAADDETMEVVLNINGMPVPMRIRKSQLGTYAQWMGAPTPNKPTEDSRTTQLASELAEMRKRDDDRREREIADLRAQMNTPRGPSPESEKIRELEQQMAKDREDRYARDMAELKRQNDQTNAALNRMSGPNYLLEQQRAEAERARALGYIPASEVNRLDETQIELEAKRKAVQRKDEATAGLYEIGKDKLASTGKLREKIANSPMTDKLLDRLAGQLDDTGDRAHGGAGEPTPEEIQAMMAGAPPPAGGQPTPPPGATGGPPAPMAARMQ